MAQLLTSAEVAKRLKVSKSTVHRLARSGELKPEISNSAGDFFAERTVAKYEGKHPAKEAPQPVSA